MNDLTNIHIGDTVVIHGVTKREGTVEQEGTNYFGKDYLAVRDPKSGYLRAFLRETSWEINKNPAVFITAKEPSNG